MQVIDVPKEPTRTGFTRLFPGIDQAIFEIKKLEININSNPSTREQATENKEIKQKIQKIIQMESFQVREILHKRWPDISS